VHPQLRLAEDKCEEADARAKQLEKQVNMWFLHTIYIVSLPRALTLLQTQSRFWLG